MNVTLRVLEAVRDGSDNAKLVAAAANICDKLASGLLSNLRREGAVERRGRVRFPGSRRDSWRYRITPAGETRLAHAAGPIDRPRFAQRGARHGGQRLTFSGHRSSSGDTPRRAPDPRVTADTSRPGVRPAGPESVEDLVELVQQLDQASRNLLAWLAPGRYCCARRMRGGYCTNPRCIASAADRAADWAREAAAAANVLLDHMARVDTRRTAVA